MVNGKNKKGVIEIYPQTLCAADMIVDISTMPSPPRDRPSALYGLSKNPSQPTVQKQSRAENAGFFLTMWRP